MKRNVTKIEKLGGINDMEDPYEFGFTELVTGTNVDITKRFKVRRRKGHSRQITMTVDAGWSDNIYTILMSGTNLYRVVLDNVGNLSTVLLESGLPAVSGNHEFSAVRVGSRLFVSIKDELRVINNYSINNWGVESPKVPPTLSLTTGNLLEGRYLVGYTYVRSDGYESGTFAVGHIDVPANSGINISNILNSIDPDIVEKHIYITTSNGDILYKNAVIDANQTSIVYDVRYVGDNLPLLTQFKDRPMPGQVMENFRGHILIGIDNILYWTDPLNYELVDYRKNFIMFSSPIKIIAAVEDGVFVGTEDEILFIDGIDLMEAPRVFKADYGVILGTLSKVDSNLFNIDGIPPDSKAVMFVTDKGISVGFNGGVFINLTESKVAVAESKIGASLFRQQSGLNQFLTVLIDKDIPFNLHTDTLPTLNTNTIN